MLRSRPAAVVRDITQFFENKRFDPDGDFWGVYLVRESVEHKTKKATLERSGAGDARFL